MDLKYNSIYHYYIVLRCICCYYGISIGNYDILPMKEEQTRITKAVYVVLEAEDQRGPVNDENYLAQSLQLGKE